MTTLAMPVGLPFPDVTLISRQGPQPGRNHWHQGIDIGHVLPNGRAERGVHGGPIAAGTVFAVCPTGGIKCSGYGNTIVVQHGGDLFSQYSHLDHVYVAPGDVVNPGDHMYDVGVTFGTPEDPARVLAVPHVHFEILHAGWPFGASNVAARYDVLSVLAASGIVLDGQKLALGDPTDYHEAVLAMADPAHYKNFSPVPKALDWPSWPVYVAFALTGLVSLAIALAPGGRRHEEDD